MSQFKFLLTMLTITAAVTLSTFIPTEIHDFGMEASAATMSVYSELEYPIGSMYVYTHDVHVCRWYTDRELCPLECVYCDSLSGAHNRGSRSVLCNLMC